GLDLLVRQVDAAVNAALPGEPERALLVEGRGVEVGALETLRQREQLHRLASRIEARDRVLPAFGDPGRAVGTDDHAVRRRALAERDLLDLAGLWIENAERALILRSVPHLAVRRGGDIVRMRAGCDRKIRDAVGPCRTGRQRREERGCKADHCLPP